MPGDTTRRGDARRFIEMAIGHVGDECLLWPYAKLANGYGSVTIGGQRHNAHRYVLTQARGPAPAEGMHAAHQAGVCHSRACVNPAHLRWATVQENSDDKRADGTACLKLTRDVVESVLGSSLSLVRTARRTGISPTMVAKIRARPDHYRQLLS